MVYLHLKCLQTNLVGLSWHEGLTLERLTQIVYTGNNAFQYRESRAMLLRYFR